MTTETQILNTKVLIEEIKMNLKPREWLIINEDGVTLIEQLAKPDRCKFVNITNSDIVVQHKHDDKFVTYALPKHGNKLNLVCDGEPNCRTGWYTEQILYDEHYYVVWVRGDNSFTQKYFEDKRIRELKKIKPINKKWYEFWK